MQERNARGFTLVELLIVVAIVGIVSAIAIPNLLNAIDRGRQKRTMSDLRAVGTAVEAYAVDLTIHPTAANVAALAVVLEPLYVDPCPTTDAWQNTLVYEPGSTPGQGYTLRSVGKDGIAEAAPAGGATQDFDCDIVFLEGRFVQWPDGSQQ